MYLLLCLSLALMALFWQNHLELGLSWYSIAVITLLWYVRWVWPLPLLRPVPKIQVLGISGVAGLSLYLTVLWSLSSFIYLGYLPEQSTKTLSYLSSLLSKSTQEKTLLCEYFMFPPQRQKAKNIMEFTALQRVQWDASWYSSDGFWLMIIDEKSAALQAIVRIPNPAEAHKSAFFEKYVKANPVIPDPFRAEGYCVKLNPEFDFSVYVH